MLLSTISYQTLVATYSERPRLRIEDEPQVAERALPLLVSERKHPRCTLHPLRNAHHVQQGTSPQGYRHTRPSDPRLRPTFPPTKTEPISPTLNGYPSPPSTAAKDGFYESGSIASHRTIKAYAHTGSEPPAGAEKRSWNELEAGEIRGPS